MDTVKAAAEIGDEDAIEVLIDAMNDRSWQVSQRAATLLGDTDSSRALDALIEIVTGPKSGPRRHAAAALGRIGDKRAVEPLIQLLRSRGRGASSAAYALSRIPDERSVLPLIEAIAEPSWDMRKYGANALGEIGDPRAIDPLIAIIDERTNQVWRDVSAALVKITGETGVPTKKMTDVVAFWRSYRKR